MNTLSDETLLERVLTGDLSPSDPLVVERCRTTPAFAAELAELSALAGRLDRAASEERDVLAGADRLHDAPGRDLVRDAVRRLALQERFALAAEPEAGREPPRRPAAAEPVGKLLGGPWRPWLAAAAAVLLAFFAGAKWFADSERQSAEYAGGASQSEIGLQLVRDAASDERRLVWSLPLEPGEKVVLRLYREGLLEPLVTVEVESSQWLIPAEFADLEALSVSLSVETERLEVLDVHGPFDLAKL